MLDEQERLASAFTYAERHQDRFVEQLKALLRIPSVSTSPEHGADVRRAAEFLCRELVTIGLHRARLVETGGHPLVLAEWLEAPGTPTILLYGHYDVQPAVADQSWRQADPFDPEIRGDDIYARGACDDKGQLLALLKALEALHAGTGDWPVNIRVLIEGEEESGGAGIAAFVTEHPDQVACDAVVVADTSMPSPDVPAIVYGVRGIVYAEIRARGAQRDLHSGDFGGIAPNPLYALACILAGLRDANGRVALPDLYARLEPVPYEERLLWQRNTVDILTVLQREMGIPQLVGEPGIDPYECLWARPTFEVHGIRGGFVEDGAKTVIPAEATAKVSLRLPPELHLSPEEVLDLLRQRMEPLCPAGIHIEVTEVHGGRGVVVPWRDPFVQVACRALEDEWGRPPDLVRSGGSIPVGELFQRVLQVPVVFMGTGLPDDNIHAPNEKYHLPNFAHLIRQTIRFLVYLGNPPSADVP